MSNLILEYLSLFEPFYIIILVILGLIGNSIAFFVFTQTKLRQQEASYFLAAISLTDTGFLLTLFTVNLQTFNLNIFNSHNYMCKLIVFSTYLFSFLSVWFIVMFTTQRFIIVYFPLKRKDYCTRKINLFVIVVLVLISITIYSFSLVTAGIEQESYLNNETNSSIVIPKCVTLKEWFIRAQKFSLADMFLTIFMPICLIFALNISIMLKLKRRFCTNALDTLQISQPKEMSFFTVAEDERSFKRLNQISFSESVSSKFRKTSVLMPHGTLRRTTRIFNVTDTSKMLLIISNVFLLLNIPIASCKLWFYFKPSKSFRNELTTSEEILERITCYIYYLNFSLNFFFYSCFGSKFRAELLKFSFFKCVFNRILFK
jgi:hypothetical protein